MLTVDFKRLELRPRARVLDIGCGNGRHALEALRLGAEVTAIDVDVESLLTVDQTAAMMVEEGQVAEGGSLRTLVADARRLPLPDGHFDVIIAAEVLEHIEQDVEVMAELCRVLRPGGVIAVTVPRWWPEKVCWAMSREYHDFPGGHTRIYRRSELMQSLQASGLVIAGAHHYAHALHAPYWWLRCAVGVKRDQAVLARLYHRLLVYDLMRHPSWTRLLERALNPVLGKSLVVYARRPTLGAAVLNG